MPPKVTRLLSGSTKSKAQLFDGEKQKLLDGFVFCALKYTDDDALALAKAANERGALVAFSFHDRITHAIVRPTDLPLHVSQVMILKSKKIPVISSKYLDDCLAQEKRLDWNPYVVNPSFSTNAPVSSAPVSTAPVSTAPDTTAPVSSTPDTTIPVSSTPDTTAPDTTAPVSSTPDTTVPVSSAPVSSAPVAISTHKWQWRGDTGWVDYSAGDSAVIETSYISKASKCLLNPTYSVDMKNSVQMRNDQPHRQRAVRRVPLLGSALPVTVFPAPALQVTYSLTPVAQSSAPTTKTTSGTKTVVKKKGGAVDPGSGLENQTHILVDNSLTYNATLNFTDITSGKNNNKFYIIQLLESDTSAKWHVFSKWGRVGYDGQTELKDFSRKEDAIAEFKKKFLTKTGASFSNLSSYTPVPGKYRYLEMDDDSDPETDAVKSIQLPPSKLESSVQDVIRLICDVKMLSNTLIQYEIDTNKMPLGKISTTVLKEAMSYLKNIENELKSTKPNRKVIESESSNFYTAVPHDFGRRTPPIIDDFELLKSKTKLLEDLQQLEIAKKVIDSGVSLDIHPIDASYQALKCDMKALSPTAPEHDMIMKYVNNTHGATHHIRVSVLNIYEMDREGETAGFSAFQGLHNRRLLWHGSRLSNFTGIIKQGLRIAPPEAPVTGYMYGKGVYFADCITKSANYCHSHLTNNEGIMLLCEVALGNMAERLQADPGIKMQSNEHSCFGLGQYEPDPLQNHTTSSGMIVPSGKIVQTKHRGTLLYNEFIVYDIRQVKIRYMLRVKIK